MRLWVIKLSELHHKIFSIYSWNMYYFMIFGEGGKKAPIHPDLKLTSWKLSFSKLSTDINFPSRFVPLFIVNCEWNKKDHLKIVLRNNDDHHMKEKYHHSILNASSKTEDIIMFNISIESLGEILFKEINHLNAGIQINWKMSDIVKWICTSEC